MSSGEVSTNEGLEVEPEVLENLQLIPFRLTTAFITHKVNEFPFSQLKRH